MSELKRKRCSDDELDSTKRIRLNTHGPSCYMGNQIVTLQKRPIELIEEHSEAKQVRSMEPRRAVSARNGFLDRDRASNTSGRNRNRGKQIRPSERFPQSSDKKTSDEKTIRCRKHNGTNDLEPLVVKQPRSNGHKPSTIDRKLVSALEVRCQEPNLSATRMALGCPESSAKGFSNHLIISAKDYSEEHSVADWNGLEDPMNVFHAEATHSARLELIQDPSVFEEAVIGRCGRMEHGQLKELISTSPIDLSKERLNESGEDRILRIAAAAHDIPDSSKAPNPRKDGGECGDIPTEDSIHLSPIKIQKGRILKAEENLSAIELVAADDLPKLSKAASNEDTVSDVDDNSGSPESLPAIHPMAGTSFQAASNPPKSKFLGPSNRTYKNMSEITNTQVLSTFEPVELKDTQATALPQYRTDEEMCQYYIHSYKHLALDITKPPAPNKSKNSGTSHNNYDEAIASEEEEDDEEERIEKTCLTWQSAVESTMDELKRLIRMSDKPLKVPKDYLCAAEQFRAFKEFQQDTEALMLRFRHGLDKTRYTADGSLREELVDDDRELYWDPFKGEKEFVDRFGQEPPMIPVPNHSGYFREEDEPIVIYKPPESPLIAPKPQNTPISNICLESGQLYPDLITSKTTAVARGTFNSRRPDENFYDALSPNHNSQNTNSRIMDDKYNEEVAEGISDTSRSGSSSTSSTSDNDESDADTQSSVSDECDDADVEVEREKSEHGCCWVRLKPDGSIDNGCPERTKETERDKMSDRTQDFCRTLLQYERNKHSIENWSDADRRKERTEYVRSALNMVEASLKGTLEELPKWRPDLTDYQHDQLIFEEGPGDNEVGAIEAITELKCRLGGAELLLKRSAMNKRWEGSGLYV